MILITNVILVIDVFDIDMFDFNVFGLPLTFPFNSLNAFHLRISNPITYLFVNENVGMHFLS